MEYILNIGMPRILRVDMENFNPENLVFMENGHTVMGNELPVAKLFLIICCTTCVNLISGFYAIWHPLTKFATSIKFTL